MPTSIVRRLAVVVAAAGTIVLLASGSAFAATVYSDQLKFSAA